MPKIHKLSSDIIAKIAAGEVIERPSFAVKELLENSIDAKATNIEIQLEQAGLKKIQVTDSGEGMDTDDVKNCWLPHTTSKLDETNGLTHIQSLGFRGEALSSLAAISTLTIKSRQQHASIGYQVEIDNGKLTSSQMVGMPQGTVIRAENLFAAIPARKKFLKSLQTEFRHVYAVVESAALAHPEIRFALTHNNRLILDLPAHQTISDRTEKLLGESTFSLLIPFTKEDSYVSLTGFLGKPQLTTSATSKQILFINNRHVSDKMIALAVKESFGTMLESTRYPVFVISLTLPFEMVDVNVHPRKEQVSLHNNKLIFQTVKQLMQEVLQENNISFYNLSWARQGVGTTKSYAANLLRETVLEKYSLQPVNKTSFTQLHNLYILFETKQGFVFVDQHAAHERILFERLKKEFLIQKKKQKPFVLPEPLVLDLTQSEHLLLQEHKKLFHSLGFILRSVNRKPLSVKNKNHDGLPLSVDALIITHLPSLFQDRNPQEVVKQLLENLEQETIPDVDTISEEMLAFLACRAAVKAGDVLTQEQMRQMSKDLEHTPNNATCPHGRPTHVIYSLQELNNIFKRT